MIRYAAYEVRVHRLKLQTVAEAEALAGRIRVVLESLFPEREFEADLEVELSEYAGTEEQSNGRT